MRNIILIFLIFTASLAAFGQVDNGAVARRIRDLKAEKQIRIEPNPSGNTTKLIAVAENFSVADEKRAKVEAMNFAIAVFYAGTLLDRTPEQIDLAFWVMTKEPRFAAEHRFVVKAKDGELDLGDARYASRRGEKMEYLNFKLARKDVEAIAGSPTREFKLGSVSMTFTPGQISLIRNFLSVTQVP